jgi:hypothetical protein
MYYVSSIQPVVSKFKRVTTFSGVCNRATDQLNRFQKCSRVFRFVKQFSKVQNMFKFSAHTFASFTCKHNFILSQPIRCDTILVIVATSVDDIYDFDSVPNALCQHTSYTE